MGAAQHDAEDDHGPGIAPSAGDGLGDHREPEQDPHSRQHVDGDDRGGDTPCPRRGIRDLVHGVTVDPTGDPLPRCHRCDVVVGHAVLGIRWRHAYAPPLSDRGRGHGPPVPFVIAVPFGTAAHADDSDVQTQAAKEPVTVEVPVRTIDTPGRSGQSGIIEITVGTFRPDVRDARHRIGGLRLWGGRPAGIRLSSKSIDTFLDGVRVPGLLGKAPMGLRGVTTTLDVPFQLIDTDSSYIQQWKRQGIVGILGIGVGSGALTNPLVALPGALGLRWSVHFARNAADTGGRQGALILGAEPPADATMHFQLPYIGLNVNGARLWNDHAADGCWTFGSTPLQCVPTWFDSGFTVMRVKGRQFSRVPQTPTNLVRSGTPVRLSAGSSAFVGHRFVAGDTGSRNLVRVIPRGRRHHQHGQLVLLRLHRHLRRRRR